ncbi:hypothetical protein AB0D95_24440, partial [Streptomyces chilikensis]
STFSQDYMEDTLRDNVHTTRLLVSLFEARLSPERRLAGSQGRSAPHQHRRPPGSTVPLAPVVQEGDVHAFQTGTGPAS